MTLCAMDMDCQEGRMARTSFEKEVITCVPPAPGAGVSDGAQLPIAKTLAPNVRLEEKTQRQRDYGRVAGGG
jgi:hypothetical protein